MASRTFEVYRLDLATRGVTRLTTTRDPLANGNPAWRPSGDL
jgi:hypothetical protein